MFIDLALPRFRDLTEQNKELQKVKQLLSLKKMQVVSMDAYFSFLAAWLKGTMSEIIFAWIYT